MWDGYTADMAGRAVVGTMKHTWKALADRFGPMDAEAITIADCRAHTDQRRAAGIKDGTIHTELGHLRMVLKWAEKHRLINRAPAIERPTKPEPKEGYLTRGEVARMIEKANAPHIQTAIMLLIGTGARSAAARELTWDRVDFERRMIQLRNPFDKSRRKGRATVPMNDTLVAALSTAKTHALSLFVIEWAGKPVMSIKRGLKAAGTAINRSEVSPHMLRHSAAVWLAEDGHSMEEIAQFLGHNNTKMTTLVYARFSPTHLRRLADSLNT
jgi:integrase